MRISGEGVSVKSPFPPTDYTGLEMARGRVGNFRVVHKFGRNAAVGTSFVPITDGGIYQTPTTAASLEFVSGDAADALNGAGMRELTVQGLDANWAEQTVITAAHATDGTTAVAIDGTWMRVYRAWVSLSGTYAVPGTSGSHVGAITIRVASAGATWGIIDSTDIAKGQSEIGYYTVPLGEKAYIQSIVLSPSSVKALDVVLFQRHPANDVTAPYSGTMRASAVFDGLATALPLVPKSPLGPYTGPCDLGFLAKVGSTTGSISVDYEIWLEKI